MVSFSAMSKVPRLGILGSGSGSNCQSIYDAIQAGTLNAEIVVVLSDIPDAFILERARSWGVPAEVIDCGGFKTKFPDESQAAVAARLKEYDVDLVCLAGFMRLVKAPLLNEFPNRIINIHPSLLPNFPGLHAWEQAVNAGATESGCTVHYVDAGMDTGPILGQARVPVLPNDTAASLHARIQVEEHKLYPAMITKVLESL
ncbi:MAG: phosphoribosylglycinamide formyltransferase [Akkermansia sp.]|nr:phosphoribosylglycinamide formyltransferase [Akkermansia sp.]